MASVSRDFKPIRHVAVIDNTLPVSLTHIDIESNTVLNHYVMWNRGDRYEIVDKDEETMFNAKHTDWDLCWGWFLREAHRIDELNISCETHNIKETAS